MDVLTPLAILPGSGPNQRIQVALAQGPAGRLTIDLREQHYAPGIGWFDQRTLALEPRQFQELQSVLRLHDVVLREEGEEPPATLPFPGPADVNVRRRKAGEGA